MGRTVSDGPGYAPDDDYDPRIDDFVLSERNYLHFDNRLERSERQNFRPTKSEILKNSFWPLIGYTLEERRLKKDASGSLVVKPKKRPIKFGSHKDAAILQFYAKSLSRDYEEALGAKGFSKSILAYRPGIGNNIDHAKSLFDEIRSRKNCTAIAIDISGFFDNVRHDVLFSQLKEVRNTARLSDVDFYLFQRMTKFEWVDSEVLEERLGSKYGRAGRICYPKDFRRLVRKGPKPGIQRNKEVWGIPQGTPLSGLYANISLLEFDQAMINLVQLFEGSYRRYSDDIAFLLPDTINQDHFLFQARRALDKIGLQLSEHKTEAAQFYSGKLTGANAKAFQYLGFTFNGSQVLIRASSLTRYYSKMNRGIHSKIRAAKNKGVPSDEIYMRELFQKYTHFGKSRNFPRYAYRAADVFSAPEIRGQLRRHMTIFKRMVKRAITTIY